MRVKFKKDQFMFLRALIEDVLKHDMQGNTGRLMQAVLAEVLVRMVKQSIFIKKEYDLTFKPSELMAFKVLMECIKSDPYMDMVIGKIVGI